MATTLAIVGAGRVGTALGRGLREAGWRITAVVTRSRGTARQAVRAIGGGRGYGILTRLVLEARVILICAPDAALPQVAAQLAEMGSEEWAGKIALHTSGALDRRVLGPIEEQGAATGSLHPMCNFGRRTAPSLSGILFAVEGVPAAVRAARRMARDLGGFPLQLEGGKKPAYHAAEIFAKRHVLTLLEAAARILADLGFSRRQATKALLVLARQVLQAQESYGVREARSGALDPGGFQALAEHMRALREYPPEYANAYVALDQLTGRLLERAPRLAVECGSKVLAKGQS
jgi:predicted short-subunit dehydrogenase-like oxidoreductase (DUF2520 family)